VANSAHLARLREGTAVWNAWRTRNRGERVDLRGVDLRGADLLGIDLSSADFEGANLREIDLRDSILRGTNFDEADLTGASLLGACMHGVRLHRTNLSAVDLRVAVISEVFMSDAKVSGAKLGWTTLSGVNLKSFCETDELHHETPSTVDHRAIAQSLRLPNLAKFLIAAGMPRLLVDFTIDSLRALDPNELFSLMQSTFISYGGPDEAFARKLNQALQNNGVTTFFFPETAEPGAKLHRVMREGVNLHDRLILVCSAASLNRPGVLNEIQETLAREARDGGAEYIIPIKIDNFVHDGWAPKDAMVKTTILDRVVADFQHADESSVADATAKAATRTKFEEQLSRLLRALRKPSSFT
jgi:uncharacterized protein YjbI with pentapeptide repeats